MAFPFAAFAGVANTSATAGSGGWGPGTAAATANYDGDGVGFTKTKASSGKLNVARGLSVGFDQTGLSVSHSYAVAGQRGPAVGGTLNVHIGQNGVAVSGGQSVASQGRSRQVNVAGQAGSNGRRPTATAAASGHASGRGVVNARTFSRSSDRYDSRRRVASRRPTFDRDRRVMQRRSSRR
ncbi:MAG: hypothetical protein DHS20C16_18370 [Phycisphaerae bacterium]|nr:MAG: hypothetical protein DHS20C16_18370 [Phycisphaerae bacterium]